MSSSENIIDFPKQKLDHQKIIEKRKVLEKVAAQLKSEFFGLDEIIDKVIQNVSAWYIFPEIITRPVIINLWGMTGVGKTQLVRRLVALLGFDKQFVEVQMDGGSVTSTYNANSLTRILGESSIEEGNPGVLLLDEIQRFRTIDNDGNDVKLERFHDIWTLLSDGKFSADSAIFMEIEMMLADHEWMRDNFDEDDSDEKPTTKKKKKPKQRQFNIYPYQAKSLKKVLRLPYSVSDIMRWDLVELTTILEKHQNSRVSWEIDYTKLLIFVSGNLDNAFSFSTNTDDCDTDADFYHEATKKISSMDIKSNLRSRFRPEQISRLGNNHIIYPSMSRRSYEQLIEVTCRKYVDEMASISDITYNLGQSLYREIYNNSVYPTQGTRPVFSSIHLIFSSVLVNATFWALEIGTNEINIDMSSDAKTVIIQNCASLETISIPVELEINAKKEKTSKDVRTLIAVHESGHAIVYAKLKGCSPHEVKINTASFTGGYMLPTNNESNMRVKQQVLDDIAILLAGSAAEETIFGKEQRTVGSSSDIYTATKLASDLVRKHGLSENISYVNSSILNGGDVSWVTEITETNEEVKSILEGEYIRAKSIIRENLKPYSLVVDTLIEQSTLSCTSFVELMKPYMELNSSSNEYNFSKMWEVAKQI